MPACNRESSKGKANIGPKIFPHEVTKYILEEMKANILLPWQSQSIK